MVTALQFFMSMDEKEETDSEGEVVTKQYPLNIIFLNFYNAIFRMRMK